MQQYIMLHSYSTILLFTAHFLPFGASFGDQVLQGVDDDSTGPLVKNQSCLFYGNSQDTIYVCEIH